MWAYLRIIHHIHFTTLSFLIQYRHGLWKPALESMDVRTEGYVFTDNEMLEFYNHFYAVLQKKLASVKAERETVKDMHLKDELTEQCQHICIASNILGDPNSKRTPAQASFRRDLCIVCEGWTTVV